MDPTQVQQSLLTEEKRYPNGAPLIAPIITAGLVVKHGYELAQFTLPGTETHCSSTTIHEAVALLSSKEPMAKHGAKAPAAGGGAKADEPASVHVTTSILKQARKPAGEVSKTASGATPP